MTKTVLVLGSSGNFGAAAAKAFASAGWTVRTYRRGTDMLAAARGVDVIVNAMNPPKYHAWDKIIPAITAEVISVAEASGATVIVPGNVYVYGDQPGPWGTETPHRPVARKGRVRAEMEAAYRAAASRGVRSIILRGGDFLDPSRETTIMRMVVLKGLTKGKIAAMGAPDTVRAYAYLPDMARAAVALAERRDTLPAFADIPFPGHAMSTNDLADAIGRLTGQRPRITRFAWWPLALLSPFWELARELREMRYLYETPHRLSDRVFFDVIPGFETTPLDQVVALHLPQSGQVDINPHKAMA